jgi:hypothetical protein
MKLTKAAVADLEGPLYQVWSIIGYDVLSACEEAGEKLDYETVIECCIDANRLTEFVKGDAGLRAEARVKELINEHGYDRVLKFLAKTFPMG